MSYFKKHWDPELLSKVEDVVQTRVRISFFFFDRLLDVDMI